MSMPYELQLAARNLARHSWHMLAMVVGLAIAVLVMIYIPSTMGSFYDDLIDRAIEQTSAHVTVWPREKPQGLMRQALVSQGLAGILALEDYSMPRQNNLNGWHAITASVAASPGVVAVVPFVRGNATVRRGTVDLGITIEGADLRQYGQVVNLARHFPDGHLPELGPSDVAIGFRMADKLGVRIGEHLHISTARAGRLMRVKAIFQSGYYDRDLHQAYVSLAAGQRMLDMGSEVSGLAARTVELAQAADVSLGLRQSLPYKVRNWRDDNSSLLAEVATVNRVTFLINLLVAAVAPVGIANVFSMFVVNRQKELAILRAIGASRASLRTILMIEAAFIWLIGAILGTSGVLAVMAYEQAHPYAVSAETYGIGSYATQPKAAAFAIATVLAAATMAGSAWWSGRRAARLNPADVIFGR